MTRTAPSAPRLLISVRSADEALIAASGGADIIDIKEPRAGVLGAASPQTIRAIVDAVGGRRPVSATVGDIPLAEASAAAAATASLGVDYVKIGAFPSGGNSINLAPFAPLAADGMRLILVIFADLAPDFALVAQAAAAGFKGVMLDTATKGQGGLRAHLSHAALAQFIAEARRARLMVGLAGSLRAADIAPLAALRPDILGFRGAACAGGLREEALDLAALTALRRLIPQASADMAAIGSVDGKLLVQEA